MKNFILLSFILLVFHKNYGQNAIPSAADQIKATLQAAPEEKREQATVLGYDQKGNLVTLKAGSNEFICLADDPQKEGFSAACYQKDLADFMARGRELSAEGKNENQNFEIREAEAKSGKLKMPDHPSTLYILYGKDAKYNPAKGVVEHSNLRWVVYIPWATAESTGLPTKPMVDGGPWIMFPGTHKAHIMITPPWPKED
ncbi:MAG: hypothetical protein U1C58_11985 [Flavobacteriaceae bacterium]|nr:hypothetical protein [Flavobacteriaceae bacterium]